MFDFAKEKFGKIDNFSINSFLCKILIIQCKQNAFFSIQIEMLIFLVDSHMLISRWEMVQRQI